MEILPDPVHTALLTLPFLVALVSLHLILWRPLLEYLDAREEASARARHEAQELDGAAAEQLGRIEDRLTSARVKVGELRKSARARALVKESEIVAAAREAADHRVDQAVGQIAAERDLASATLKGSAQDLSRDIAAQVLGRAVRS